MPVVDDSMNGTWTRAKKFHHSEISSGMGNSYRQDTYHHEIAAFAE